MILLVHIHTCYGHSDHLTDDSYQWPLTCEAYDSLDELIQDEYERMIPKIIGITPLAEEPNATPLRTSSAQGIVEKDSSYE